MGQPKDEDTGSKVKLVVVNRCQSDLNSLVGQCNELGTIGRGYSSILSTHKTGQIMPLSLYENQGGEAWKEQGKVAKRDKSAT